MYLLTAAIFACKLGGMGVEPPGRLPRRPVRAMFLGARGAILFGIGVGLGRCSSGFGFESDIGGCGGLGDGEGGEVGEMYIKIGSCCKFGYDE